MDESDAAPTVPWNDLERVGTYPSLALAHDCSLVILAMGEACWVTAAEAQSEFTLHAESGAGTKVRRELELYAQEMDEQQRERNRPQWIEPAQHAAGWEMILLWMTALTAVFYFQGQDFTLVGRGSSSSIGLIDRHEWWRPFTALFLHADLQHLIGNLLSGMIFAALVSKSFGPLRGWLMILFCGTLGNVLTAWIHYPKAFYSIGASTAVFAALGILTGLGFSASLHHQWRVSWIKTAAPIMAGLVLLGSLGGGGENVNTDVLGHLFGFSSGLLSGWIASEIRQKSEKS